MMSLPVSCQWCGLGLSHSSGKFPPSPTTCQKWSGNLTRSCPWSNTRMTREETEQPGRKKRSEMKTGYSCISWLWIKIPEAGRRYNPWNCSNLLFLYFLLATPYLFTIVWCSASETIHCSHLSNYVVISLKPIHWLCVSSWIQNKLLGLVPMTSFPLCFSPTAVQAFLHCGTHFLCH